MTSTVSSNYRAALCTSKVTRAARASGALLALIALSGCASVSNFGEGSANFASSLFAKNHANEFRNTVYAGASAGTTRLSPDTSETRFSLSDQAGASTQLRLGVDVNPLLSLELDSSVLGAATVREVEADVQYTSLTASTVFYALGKPANRARRIGWQGFGRLGYSLVQRASVIQPFDTSESSLLVGVGAEYGFRNGLSVRGEVARFDGDAIMFGIGMVYRLGLSAGQFGNVVASVAKDSIPTDMNATSEPTLGAARPDTAKALGHVSLVHAGPHASLWSAPKHKDDIDGDGVLDVNDGCNDTVRNTAVNQNGCGLFDAILVDVTFKPGAHWLSPKSRRAIDDVVGVLLAFPEARVEVQAHADGQGSDDINQIVSEARAQAVADYMKKHGVGEKQVVAKGYGESMPIADDTTAEGRQLNRRVQLVTLPSLTPSEIASQDTGVQNFTDQSVKTNQPTIEVTMEDAEIKALAQLAHQIEEQEKRGSPTTPEVAAALPAQAADQPSDTKLPPAVRIRSLALGGPLNGVKFTPGTANLESTSTPALEQLVRQLKLHSGVKVALRVHVSEQDDAAANLALSQRQANTLVDYLRTNGIEKTRLQGEAYGNSLPVAQTVTESDRHRNRRVELRVINPPGR